LPIVCPPRLAVVLEFLKISAEMTAGRAASEAKRQTLHPARGRAGRSAQLEFLDFMKGGLHSWHGELRAYSFFGNAMPVSACHTRMTKASSLPPCPFAAAARNN
jgi:hypothetical protein